MKIRQVVIGLIGLIALGISFGVGRYFRPIPLVNHDWDIYVSKDPNSTTGHCLASSPIQLMSYNNDRVRWLSEDNKYRVDFTDITTPIPPDPVSGTYQQESPLEPTADHVPFDQGSPTRKFNVHHKVKYYYYQIVDQSTGNPCKIATEDRDTGLNVKR
jgi:hypothetical protein